VNAPAARRLVSFARLSRLQFLAGGFAGAALGTAIAAYERGTIDWNAYVLAQCAVTAFHLMTHYGNDYFDRSGDRPGARTAFSGGSGVLVEGSLAPGVALGAAVTALGAGCAATAALAVAGHHQAALVAVAIGILAWSYSAPPPRLSARGWGEINAAVVVAVLVPLCAFCAQSGAPDPVAFAATLPGACAMLAMMLAVEFPDAAADAASGKRNLVVRLGPDRAARLAYAAIAGAFACAGISLALGVPATAALLQAPSLYPAWVLARAFRLRDEPGGPARLARSGVAFFFLVSLGAVLGFALATNLPHARVER
jgi:1,4-dihydroxy-2-naphthoate octaprenyltransferase